VGDTIKIVSRLDHTKILWESEKKTLKEAVVEAVKAKANLCGADLREADLRGANLCGANLDFSCWGLSCKSTNAKVGDRIFGQLFFHLTRIDVSLCSGGVQEAMEHLKSMAASDLFCEYRDDVRKLEG